MDSVNMERQAALALEIPQSVAVVGCGGVGSWTAYLLALAGVPEIWLFDFDTVSDSNLNRIPVPAAAVGKPKSLAVADMIKAVRPDCVVMPCGAFDAEHADRLSLGDVVTWIIATTDTVRSRRAVEQWAAERAVSYIEAAAEGDIGSATGAAADWQTPDEETPGYASVPVWVGPCIAAANLAVSHVIHNQPMGDRVIRMGWREEGFEVYDSLGDMEDAVAITPLGGGYDILRTGSELATTVERGKSDVT